MNCRAATTPHDAHIRNSVLSLNACSCLGTVTACLGFRNFCFDIRIRLRRTIVRLTVYIFGPIARFDDGDTLGIDGWHDRRNSNRPSIDSLLSLSRSEVPLESTAPYDSDLSGLRIAYLMLSEGLQGARHQTPLDGGVCVSI